MKLAEIEIILKEIKLKGRQSFLETEHNNFIRVAHDYSDSKKDLSPGKVCWKKNWFRKYDFCWSD